MDKRYTYDSFNRLTSATDPYGNQNRRYQYDSLGNLTYEQTGNNKSQDFKYNNLNQFVSKKVDNQWDYTYAYDAANRMVQGTNQAGEISRYPVTVWVCWWKTNGS